MLRGGFSETDLEGEGSHNLVNRLVAHGDAAVLAAAVRAHLMAGVDHVCVQVQPAQGEIIPALQAIASELGLASAP
jgi:hypothetical protein